MQKIVNIIAVASGVVSLAVVGSGLYVFVNRASITDGIKQQVMDAALGSFGSLGGLGGGIGGNLPVGAPDLSPTTNPDAVSTPQSSAGLGVPASSPSPF